MDYWELRKAVSKIIPRRTQLDLSIDGKGMIKEKGRKNNYFEFNLVKKEWVKKERLLNTEEMKSLINVSMRAGACPMPLNTDVWDGLKCPYRCMYCFADYFRASLYTNFFDNGKSMGTRHVDPDYFKTKLEELFKQKNDLIKEKDNEILRAIKNSIPIRLGIKYENFTPLEKKNKIALQFIQFCADSNYPIMVNTKSNLIGTDPYVKALQDNPSGAAVHVTLISSDPTNNQLIEPGAPNFYQRVDAMKNLVSAGVRPVARIEPYMAFVTDDRDDVENYIDNVWGAGVRHITFDTYSYSANVPSTRRNFSNKGFDFERMFLLGCDSQPLGSLLLEKYMDLFRDKGFSVSTFDLGNVPKNSDQVCCCEVGDWFSKKAGSSFNHGSSVRAIAFIKENEGMQCTWNDFENWVENQGGFLSNALKKEIKQYWNLEGNTAFSINWAPGIVSCGWDENGLIWTYDPKRDYRMEMLERLL